MACTPSRDRLETTEAPAWLWRVCRPFRTLAKVQMQWKGCRRFLAGIDMQGDAAHRSGVAVIKGHSR